jgi:hypothetical protein
MFGIYKKLHGIIRQIQSEYPKLQLLRLHLTNGCESSVIYFFIITETPSVGRIFVI